MVKCLPEFEYFYCILETLFLKLEDQKLQTIQLKLEINWHDKNDFLLSPNTV